MISRRLVQHFNFFFIAGKSLFFFKSYNFVLVFKINAFFFYDSEKKSFIFRDKKGFVDFMTNFFLLYRKIFSIYFLKFKVRGLGYRIKFLKGGIYRFFLGTTNYIYFYMPKEVLVKSRRRRMFLISNDFLKLRTVFVNFLLLKKLIPYKLRGIFFPKQIIFLKPGKKKF